MLSEIAFKALKDAAENPVIVFSGHPASDDAAAVDELLPLGFLQVEKPGQYEVSEAGYAFIESCGISVWRFSGVKVAA